MPIYEYICPNCGKKIELLQRLGEKAPLCKECRTKLNKIISKSSFILVGDGWSNSGYSKKSKKGKKR